MARPTVSLVVTVLNEAESLRKLLASIDAQTRQPDETIVVDGGSTDGTAEALQAWAVGGPGRTAIHTPGANIAYGRNAAIQRATGEIIAVTDAGVKLQPDWLACLAGALEADASADVASGFFVPDAHGVFECALAATTLPTAGDVDPARFLPSSRSVAFRRAAWAAVDGYPEWLDYCEDVVFDMALRDAGFRFLWVPEAVVELQPRPDLRAFFRQYYLYARGDGKANLWPIRHTIRYAVYLAGLPLLWWGRHHPGVVAAGLLAAGCYLRRPVGRLIGEKRRGEEPIASTPLALGLIPLIRLVGDVAKMAGYPVGVVWRLRHYPPPQPLRQAQGRPSPARGEGVEEPVSPGRGEGPHRSPSADGRGALPPAACELSVIIVSYDTRDRLRACLRSVEASEGIEDFETFVVDNASADGSAEMVESEFPRVRLLRSRVNGGFAYANNLGLRQSQGRHVLLLNPDTEIGPRALADMLAYIRAHPEAGAVGPKLVRADGTLDPACRRSFPTPEVAFYRLSGLARLFPRSPRFGRYNLAHLDADQDAEVDAVSGAFMLVRRQALESVGLLDERFFMYGEDLDWAYRMKERGWRIRYNPRVRVLHHKGESSRQTSQRSTIAFYRAMRVFYEKHYAPRTPRLMDRLVVAAIRTCLCWSLLKNALRPVDQRRVST